MDIDPSLFDYDRTILLDIKDTADPEQRDGVTIRDITFAGPDGPVAAYLVEPPADTPKPRPAVLWMHWLETEADDTNRQQFLPEAVDLAREGVVSLLPDGWWSTSPATWEEDRLAKWWRTDVEHDAAMSIRQTVEIRRALDVLAGRADVDQERLVYVGHDFGAMYGALALGVDHRARAALLMAGTFAFSEWFIFFSKKSDEEKQQYKADLAFLDPARWIAQAAPARLLFQFATDDFFVPKEAAEKFYGAASDPKEIRWYDAKHDLHDAAGDSKRDRTDWVRVQLGLRSEEAD